MTMTIREPSDVDKILGRVRQTIIENRMITHGQQVLAAVSAGPDSVTLLDILTRIAPDFDTRIGVAHLNHCLRGQEAEKDEKFVRRLASERNLPYFSAKIDAAAYKSGSGLSPEEAARNVRHGFLEQTARQNGYHRIALGHHSDDNAEQLLLHLLRGSGPAGLAGIPPVRGKIIRPLIDLGRSSIMAWIDFFKLEFRTDSSNSDTRFTRNRVRHRLLPLLEKEFNPNIRRALHRTATLVRREQHWLKSLDSRWSELVIICRGKNFVELEAQGLDAMAPAQAGRVLRHVLGELLGYLHGFSAKHIEQILALAAGKSGRQLHLPLGFRAERLGQRLLIYRPADANRGAVNGQWSLSLSLPNFQGSFLQVKPPGGGLLKFAVLVAEKTKSGYLAGQDQAYFDMDRLPMPLEIRNFRKGDRIRPFGMQGSQKVKKLFIDRKVPRQVRPSVPLLTGKGIILWVAGIRRGSQAPVTGSTKRILSVAYHPPCECK